MERSKLQFGIGLIVGIVLAAMFFMYFAPRYTTTESDDGVVKQDRWSGNTWRLVDNQWQAVSEQKKDWKGIDRVLRQALKIPERTKRRAAVLDRLRSEYPALKDINNEDLLERMKFVYAREVMSDMYLDHFMKMHGPNK